MTIRFMAMKANLAVARSFATEWGNHHVRLGRGSPGFGHHQRGHHRSWGIVKADIGIRDGYIVAIGKSGNPDTMDGVHPDLVIGAATEVIAGEGKIVTAGGIDAHIHFICPQQIETALASGITTMIGGGTGPATGTNATTCTPGAWNMHRMLEAAEAFPVNLGFLGKGNSSFPEPLSSRSERAPSD